MWSSKKFYSFIGIVIVSLVGFQCPLLKAKAKENLYSIKSLGFKEGSWANFELGGRLFNFTKEDLKVCSGQSERFSQLDTAIFKMYCQTDADCVCGVDKETGECAIGNRQFIDTSKQCPDFCTGIAGHFEIKCINNICGWEFRKK